MKFFFVFGKSLPLFPEWLRAQSFFLCTELFPVHRAFSCAQSFFLCTELFPVHRAFFLCAELFPVHRAFCRAQSFLPCTELSVVHRAFYCAQSFFQCRAQSFVLAAFATLVCQRNCCFSLQRHKTPEFGEAEFWDSLPVFCGAELRFCVWKLMFYQ